MPTAIEWTEETWNPVTGCTKVSAGCDHCYAERITERFHGPGSFDKIVLHPERLDAPLKRRKPTMWFVNSMSDLFHADVPSEFVAEVFAVMTLAQQHTFQVLTKRPGRMRHLLSSDAFQDEVDTARMRRQPLSLLPDWPRPNIWLGVSVEDQEHADKRIGPLLDTPAAVKFISAEPLLGPVDLSQWLFRPPGSGGWRVPWPSDSRPLDWVIVGGESGIRARPMDPAWVRTIRDECVEAGVPFFFKQWGGRTPKANGRELDGRTWDEMPSAGHQETGRP